MILTGITLPTGAFNTEVDVGSDPATAAMKVEYNKESGIVTLYYQVRLY